MIQPSFGGAIAVPPLPLTAAIARLTTRCSYELAAGGASQLGPGTGPLPAGRAVVLGASPGHSLESRLAEAIAVRRAGLKPIPEIDVSLIPDWHGFQRTIGAFREAADVSRVLLVESDISRSDALGAALLDVLARLRAEPLGLDGIALAAYPEGRYGQSQNELDARLETHIAIALDAELRLRVITRLSFDAAAVILWLARFRGRGFEVPVRIGIAGPAPFNAISERADQLGLGVVSRLPEAKGATRVRPEDWTNPDPIILALANMTTGQRAEALSLHVHAIAGLAPTAQWIDGLSKGRIPFEARPCKIATPR